MVTPDDERVLAAERARLETGTLPASAWRRLYPHDLWTGSPLGAIEVHLDSPKTRAAIDACEAEERYPSTILDELRRLGLADFLTSDLPTDLDPGDSTPKATLTAPHFGALNATTARRNTSLAISVGVNALALLPAWIGASDDQLQRIFGSVREGAFGAMLLTEAAHGSNLLRNETRAIGGKLDSTGAFVATPEGSDEEPTHYRVRGAKHMINGGTQHDLLFTLVRTTEHVDEDSPFGAMGCFSFMWIERGEGVKALHRWKTLPAQAADISGVAFEDTIVPADQRLGRAGDGFSLVKRTLIISRGSIASLASGTLTRALDLASTYARRRDVYGGPILALAPIREHLMRLRALDWAVAALAVKAAAMSNHHGLAAGHYTAVAKLMCCDLAEEAVHEGSLILGGRALLRDMAYEQVSRDVRLYGVFDGTSHLMQQEITGRIREESRRRAGTRKTRITDPLGEMKTVYAREPRSALVALRDTKPRNWVLPLPEYFLAMDAVPSELPLSALAKITDDLYAAYARLPGAKDDDTSDRHHAAWTLGLLETVMACVELGSPEHRDALGIAPLAEENPLDALTTRFAVKWLGARAAARVRELVDRSGIEHPLSELEAAEAQLRRGLSTDRRSLHLALSETQADPA